jgi:hypothetical protein
VNKQELAERIQYFYDIAARHGHQVVSTSTALQLFEEIAQPARLGFTRIRKNLFGRQVSTDIVHLLKFQALKGGALSLWWGVSLSYVPHKWQTKMEWHRTFKSSRFDLLEEPFEYFHLYEVHWREEEKYLAHGLYGEALLRKGLVNMWNTLQQSILTWFASVQSYEGVAEKANQQAARKWIGPRHWPDPLLVYAFTLARSGKVESAQETLNTFLKQNAEALEAQDDLKLALRQIAVPQRGM